MPFTDIGNRKIYYEIHGHGPTVALLHHGFASSKMWGPVWPSIVEAGYRVLVYDRRGYGQSEPGEDFGEFYESNTFRDENVEDLIILSEKLLPDHFHIVGQCEGGVVGVDYASKLPGRVSSLAISSTLCFSTLTMREFNALKFPKSFRELDPEIQKKMLLWHGPEHGEPLYEMARTQGGEYGTGMFDLRPKLPLVECPALVLYPDRSALFPVEQAVAFYRGLAKGELAVMPRCGHNTYEQKPEEYTRHIIDFLKRVESSAGSALTDFSMTCLAPVPSGSR